jgi:hypothetical protein
VEWVSNGLKEGLEDSRRTGKSRFTNGGRKPYLPPGNLEDIADFTTRFLKEKEMETPTGQKRRGIT